MIMREIKFRAYHKNKKQTFKVFSFCDEFIKVVTDVDLVEKFNIQDFEYIQQYTGLKDKNSVEIYEGDIFKDVLNSDQIGVVKFGEYNHCFDDNRVKTYGNHIGFYVDLKIQKLEKI